VFPVIGIGGAIGGLMIAFTLENPNNSNPRLLTPHDPLS